MRNRLIITFFILFGCFVSNQSLGEEPLVNPSEIIVGLLQRLRTFPVVLAPYGLQKGAYVAVLAVLLNGFFNQWREPRLEFLAVQRGEITGRACKKLAGIVYPAKMGYVFRKFFSATLAMIQYLLIRLKSGFVKSIVVIASLFAVFIRNVHVTTNMLPHYNRLPTYYLQNLVAKVIKILINFASNIRIIDMKSSGQEEKDNFLIVIGRQYGSGGRRIGRMLAKELGISYYDKSLLSVAAGRLGYNPRIFERKDERPPSFLRSLLSFNYGAPTANISEAPMSDEKLYESQSQVIKDICARESCVIVGRTADYIMRDHGRMVSLFVHAPADVRARALVERGEASEPKEALELAARHDKGRESYYNYYTNRNAWGHAHNYSFSFDSSRLSDAMILQAVKDMLKIS